MSHSRDAPAAAAGHLFATSLTPLTHPRPPAQVNTTLWPNFQWLDGSPQPSNPIDQTTRYAQWGELLLSDGNLVAEPNNLVPPEFCVVANYSQSRDSVWGWSDRNCDERFHFICKIAAPPPPAPPPPPPSPPPPNPPPDLVYPSSVQQATYYFNPNKLKYGDAQSACTALGGLLVAYQSAAKQAEIEGEYRRRDALLGSPGEVYWMGLRVMPYEGWPVFGWQLQDGSYQKLYNSSYQAWGVWRPGRRREPNNIFPPELCAGANFTQMADGAYGWVDMRCETLAPSICEVPCKWPTLRASPLPAALRQRRARDQHATCCKLPLLRPCDDASCRQRALRLTCAQPPPRSCAPGPAEP